MNFGTPGRKAKSDINVTPLIDIVLVLLIVFIVVIMLADDGHDGDHHQHHPGHPATPATTLPPRSALVSLSLTESRSLQRGPHRRSHPLGSTNPSGLDPQRR